MSPSQVTSCDMYVFMQFDAATCHMNSNQFKFMRHVAATKHSMHIQSPHVTCPSDRSLWQLCNKQIAGLPCNAILIGNSLPVPFGRTGVLQATCHSVKSHHASPRWFCHRHMLQGQVTLCDKTLTGLILHTRTVYKYKLINCKGSCCTLYCSVVKYVWHSAVIVTRMAA